MVNKGQFVDLQLVFRLFIGQKQGFVGRILAIVDIKGCFAGKKQQKATDIFYFCPAN
jgi:hypothetical protein